MTDQPAAFRSELPPLRIHHLLVCMAVAAVMLTVLRTQSHLAAYANMPVAVGARLGVAFAVYAVGLVLAGLTIWWRIKGYASLVQPGQWLLFAHVIPILRALAMPLIAAGLQNRPPWEKNVFLWDPADYSCLAACTSLVIVRSGVSALLFGWIAWRIADTWAWRIVLTLLALLNLWASVWGGLALLGNVRLPTASPWLFPLVSVVGGLTAVWPIVDDGFRRRRRYWTHWAGALLFVASHLVGFVGLLAFWLG